MGPKLLRKIGWVLLMDLVRGLCAGTRDLSEIQTSDTVTMEDDTEVPTAAKLTKLIDYISSQNDLPVDKTDFIIPYQVIDKTSRSLVKSGYDPYFLQDILLQDPTDSVFQNFLRHRVLLEDGRLFGMSDFRSVDDPQLSHDPSQLWLIWKHLHVTYSVTVDNDGLKSFGGIDTKVGRLEMHVQAPTSLAKSPKIEMSKVKNLESRVTGLEMVSEDAKRAICLQVESQIRNILNFKIRNILLNYVKGSLDEDSSDNELMPLVVSAKFYEVHF